MSCSRTQHGGGRSRTPDLSLRSPTLYHWATALPVSCEQRRFQSDCANAQAYPSLCWAHIILKFFSRSSFVMCFWRVRHLCDKTDAKRICFPTVWLNKFYFQASLELQSENNWPYSILFNSKALKNCLFRVKYQSNKGRVSTNFFFFSFF